jgi:hypothetical protein
MSVGESICLWSTNRSLQPGTLSKRVVIILQRITKLIGHPHENITNGLLAHYLVYHADTQWCGYLPSYGHISRLSIKADQGMYCC